MTPLSHHHLCWSRRLKLRVVVVVLFALCSSYLPYPADALSTSDVVPLLHGVTRAEPNAQLSRCIRTAHSSINIFTRGQRAYLSLLSGAYFSAVPSWRLPSIITRASTTEHVQSIVRCAQAHGTRVCARSGGHSYTGNSACAGVLIDLSLMRRVTVQTNNRIATIQPGTTLGEALVALHERRRWFAAGVCPGVGVAGFMLGGGHGPYEGRLGLACDSVTSYNMVDSSGKLRIVRQGDKRNSDLFWALCGAGGGQLGIITSFTLRTVSASWYDSVVVWRYRWPYDVGGELLAKWNRYNEHGGSIWARAEVNLERTRKNDIGVFIYGYCYGTRSTEQCERKLKEAAFFNVEGRVKRLLYVAESALHAHAFMGPRGDWGRFRVRTARPALLGMRFSDGGSGNKRVTQTSFLRTANVSDDQLVRMWSRYVDLCRYARGLPSIPWVVCMLNRFDGAINRQRPSAFAHRRANVIQEYIVGGGSREHQTEAYWRMKSIMRPFEIGVYLNYAEHGRLIGSGYASAYYGKSLQRLKKIKRRLDPNNFFSHQQPIPV